MSPVPAEDFVHRTLRPLLPDAAAVLPYLREIDANRWYSNFGPLLSRLEARLAAHFGIEGDRLVILANCTAALTLALESYRPEPGQYVALPSWTFAATPVAILRAELTPWFLDVDPGSWQLTPELVESALPERPGKLAAVVPVAPFGAAVDPAAWSAFSARHGLPVVLDAAAAFDSVTPDHAPAAVSLHATKPFGIGEGGLVLCRSASQAERLRRGSNFGFDRDRRAAMTGCNAKLSEYAAAVGLAALDAWPERRDAYAQTAARYRALLSARSEGFRLAPGFGGQQVSSTCNLLLDAPVAAETIGRLRERGIEARQWWGSGCHVQPAFASCPRSALPVTEDLGKRVFAIPFSADMKESDMAAIAAAVAEVVEQCTC